MTAINSLVESRFLHGAATTAGFFARAKAFARGKPDTLGRLQQNCAMHGAYLSDGIADLGGREAWTPCPSCVEAYQTEVAAKRAFAEAEEKRWRVINRIEAAGIPARFRDRRFDDYRVEGEAQRKVLGLAKQYVSDFHKLRRIGASLIFAGTPGTGKSLLSMIVVQELCHLGHYCTYTTCQGLIMAIRATWGKEGEGRESQVIDSFAETPFLVIDEIGVQAGTDNEKALLFDILDRRYSDMLPTVFVTNLAKPEFQAFLGDRIWDRLTENGTWVPFAWDSYRTTAKREMREALATGDLPPQRGAVRRQPGQDWV